MVKLTVVAVLDTLVVVVVAAVVAAVVVVVEVVVVVVAVVLESVGVVELTVVDGNVAGVVGGAVVSHQQYLKSNKYNGVTNAIHACKCASKVVSVDFWGGVCVVFGCV